MIEYVNKDITTVDEGVVCHGVNCQGAMGSGVAKAIKEKWPIVYDIFKSKPTGKRMLGIADTIPIKDNLYVVNCYTQVFYGYGGGRYADPKAINSCLADSIVLADMHQIPLYMPKIGCGLGGLDWDAEVEPLVRKLSDFFSTVNIIVCEYGE